MTHFVQQVIILLLKQSVGHEEMKKESIFRVGMQEFKVNMLKEKRINFNTEKIIVECYHNQVSDQLETGDLTYGARDFSKGRMGNL